MIKNTRFLKHVIRGVLCLPMAMGGWLPAMAQTVVVPVNGAPPTLTPVTINANLGNQLYPQISGDWVAYISDFLSIRYYNFATNADAAIPFGASVREWFPGISGSKIVFVRTTAEKSAVMLFDAATPAVPPIEIDPAPATMRFDAAIGGNTVAFIDSGINPNGDVMVHDLTTSVTTRLTNEIGPENNHESAAVSADGNVVVWSKFKSFPFNFRSEIWQAVRTGGVWSVSVVSTAPDPRIEYAPDSNGTLVVYYSQRGSTQGHFNSDIFWRPVAGGPEVQLQTTGIESNPRIAGNFIAFESYPPFGGGISDIFVYDIATNLLRQITDTPLVRESLSDITVLPGAIRVVWTSYEEGNELGNIKGATFSLPEVVDNTCNGLTPTITGTPGNDNIAGTNGDDVIAGLGGSDNISAGNGNDTVCGGEGNDNISGGNGIDKLFGEGGRDNLSGGDGNDQLSGGADRDNLSGGNGVDTLDGGADNDLCSGGAGNDTGTACEPFVQ